jgi:hypothetical protein
MAFDLKELLADVERLPLAPSQPPAKRLSTVLALAHAVAVAEHRMHAHMRDPQLRGGRLHDAWAGVYQTLVRVCAPININGRIGDAMQRATWSAKRTPEEQCTEWLESIRDPDDVIGPSMVGIADALRILRGMNSAANVPVPISIIQVGV